MSYGELRWQYGYATDEYGSSTVIREWLPSITVCQGSITASLRLLYGASRISKNMYGQTTVGHD